MADTKVSIDENAKKSNEIIQNDPSNIKEDPIELISFTRKTGELIDYVQLEEALGRKLDPIEFTDNFIVEKNKDKDGIMHYIIKARNRQLYDKYKQEMLNN